MITGIKMNVGDHAWALMDGKTCVVILDEDGDYYVAGGWEVPLNWPSGGDVEILEIINRPRGHYDTPNYY